MTPFNPGSCRVGREGTRLATAHDPERAYTGRRRGQQHAQPRRRLREAGDDVPLVLDVRPPAAAAAASVPDALNIPLGQLRSRLDELPRDKEIWVHCGVGKTSYFATRILVQHGFQVKNIAGGITSFKMQP